MQIEVGRQFSPMFYTNARGLPRVTARIKSIEPESPTQNADEDAPTIKGATVTFQPEGKGKKAIQKRLPVKQLVRLAHALGKIELAPGSTAETDDLIGGEVHVYIATRRKDDRRRIAWFTSLDGPYGGGG